MLENKNLTAVSKSPMIKTLKENINAIENQLHKFKSREKRALLDFLGTAIKYITGNPDNNDLININKNLNLLFENQDKMIKQMDKYTSFANHITNRYSNDLITIQTNLNLSISTLNEINTAFEIQTIAQRYHLSGLSSLNAALSDDFEPQKRDREQKALGNDKIWYMTMDPKQTTPLPKTSPSKEFYLRQTWFYNFGIHTVRSLSVVSAGAKSAAVKIFGSVGQVPECRKDFKAVVMVAQLQSLVY
ncbi:hypothetical protein FQR65_LT13598 [Abscondita terminalis]|nr:hypothetical protein FQR65_LT13598 [Abscondita terminalis]